MTKEEIEVIRERAEKATSGGWYAEITTFNDREYVHVQPGIAQDSNEDDAEFIANAREDIPALLAEVERLREALEFYGNHGWLDSIVETAEGDRYEDAPLIFYDCGKIAREVLGGGD